MKGGIVDKDRGGAEQLTLVYLKHIFSQVCPLLRRKYHILCFIWYYKGQEIERLGNMYMARSVSLKAECTISVRLPHL